MIIHVRKSLILIEVTNSYYNNVVIVYMAILNSYALERLSMVFEYRLTRYSVNHSCIGKSFDQLFIVIDMATQCQYASEHTSYGTCHKIHDTYCIIIAFHILFHNKLCYS